MKQRPLPGMPKPPKKTPGPMPKWLIQAIETKTGGFRSARWTRCPKCQQIILQGLDDDIAAFTVQADPTPINPRQETACRLTARPTYAVTEGRQIELDRRDRWSTGKPSPDRPIIPAHKCGARFPGFLLPKQKRTQGATDDECPF